MATRSTAVDEALQAYYNRDPEALKRLIEKLEMKKSIKVLVDQHYGADNWIREGTVLEVVGEYADGECWMARWNEGTVVVNKADAKEVPATQ